MILLEGVSEDGVNEGVSLNQPSLCTEPPNRRGEILSSGLQGQGCLSYSASRNPKAQLQLFWYGSGIHLFIGVFCHIVSHTVGGFYSTV